MKMIVSTSWQVLHLRSSEHLGNWVVIIGSCIVELFDIAAYMLFCKACLGQADGVTILLRIQCDIIVNP